MRFILQTHRNQSLLIPEFLITQKTEKQRFQPISKIPQLPCAILNRKYRYSSDLQYHLQGKRLLLDEIPFPLQQIQEHYENGYIQYHQGITLKNGQYHCPRCGNQAQHLFAAFQCARCHEKCTYCRNCVQMGRVSQCTPLLTWSGPFTQSANSKTELNWNGQLSPGQQTASNAVIQTIQSNQNLLIWAVCGSGKTEVLFQGIRFALQQEKTICITTPRTDVVLELTPRLKNAFPHTEIISLYSGSEDRSKTAPLTITTTHQLLRYYQHFDVVIIDEVDAFPYSVDPSLQYAVQQVKKEKSATIYLTATPNKAFKQKSGKGTLNTITIPARYHRHPLPVPTFHWCGHWKKHLKKRKKLPVNVTNWLLHHLENQKQAFLFVPHINILNDVVTVLKKQHTKIEGVHAEDPLRKEKVATFRAGEIPIVVTTTILERGVTVPNTDVAVLGAEDPIFTESALVQIAGRVGRSPTYPNGEVCFFHYGKTNAMIAAQKQILTMNHMARKSGFID